MAIDVECAEDEAIAKASRLIRSTSRYLLLVGVVGVLVGEWSGLLVMVLGAFVLGSAWLVSRFQSRLAAGMLLLSSMGLLADWLRHPRDFRVTGFLVIGAWVLVCAFALHTTIRYHRTGRESGKS